MKLTTTLAAVALAIGFAGIAEAGPQISISFGGGCNPQPVYCRPSPVTCWTPSYYYCPPTVYYGASPGYYYNNGCNSVQRFSNVSPVVQCATPVYQVPAPIYTTEPVRVYQDSSFRWRR